jgi:hypothetical protein
MVGNVKHSFFGLVYSRKVKGTQCFRNLSLVIKQRFIPKLLLLKWGVVKYSGVVQKRTNTFFTTRGQKTLVARRGFWSKVSVGNPGVLILHFFVFTKGTLKPRHSNDLTVFVPANSNFSAGKDIPTRRAPSSRANTQTDPSTSATRSVVRCWTCCSRSGYWRR